MRLTSMPGRSHRITRNQSYAGAPRRRQQDPLDGMEHDVDARSPAPARISSRRDRRHLADLDDAERKCATIPEVQNQSCEDRDYDSRRGAQ